MSDSPTFKAMILLYRRADMTVEQFHRWWLDEHAPLARQLPNVRRIVFNAAADDEIGGITELWFDTQADFDAAYATEIGQRVAADSIAHVARRHRLSVTETEVLGPSDR